MMPTIRVKQQTGNKMKDLQCNKSKICTYLEIVVVFPLVRKSSSFIMHGLAESCVEPMDEIVARLAISANKIVSPWINFCCSGRHASRYTPTLTFGQQLPALHVWAHLIFSRLVFII